MNFFEIKSKLDELEISNDAYSLNDASANEKYCISESHGKWSVYYYERGNRINEKVFNSEDQAYVYFLKQLELDSTTRIKK